MPSVVSNNVVLAVAAIGLCASAVLLYLSYETNKKIAESKRNAEASRQAAAAQAAAPKPPPKPAAKPAPVPKKESVKKADGFFNKLASDKPAPAKEPKKSEPNLGKDCSVKGIACYKKGEYEEAIAHYGEAIVHLKANTSTPKKDLCTVYHNRAAAHLKLKDHASVVADCTEALEADRVHTKSRQKRATANEALGNKRDALNDRLAIILYLQLQGKTPDKNAEKEVEELCKEIAKDEAKRILRSREDIVHPLPSETFINSYFGSFQYQGGEYPEDTLDSLTAQLTDESSDGEKGTIYYRRALLQKKNKNFAEALKDLTLAKDLGEAAGGDEAAILNEYGTFLHLQGNLTEARKCLERSSELDPSSANVWIKLAGLAFDSEDRDTAQKWFNKAVEVNPADPDVYFHRGQMSMLLEKCDEALADIRKCVDLSPSALGHMQLGIALFRVEKVDDAIRELKVAIEMDPSLPSVHNTLGEVMMATAAQATSVDEAETKMAEAMKHLKEATKVDPNFPDSYVAQGQLKLQKLQIIQASQAEAQKEVKEIEQLYEKAIEIDEQCKEAYLHAAQLALQTQQSDKAKDYFQKAIKWAKTEAELQHICQEHESALAQLAAAQSLRMSM